MPRLPKTAPRTTPPSGTTTTRGTTDAAAARPEAFVRRKPGRPARISRELILEKSMDILAVTKVEDFMIKTVAHELGTASMAIYNYFDSRDALLAAVADEVCKLFQPPKPRGGWRETLSDWLWALKEHADRYPVMPSILGMDGRTSAGWMKITAPITVLMHRQMGLSNKQLALASVLFVTTAAVMIHVLQETPDYVTPGALPRPEDLGLSSEDAAILRKAPVTRLREKELFEAFFAQLVRGLEVFLEK